MLLLDFQDQPILRFLYPATLRHKLLNIRNQSLDFLLVLLLTLHSLDRFLLRLERCPPLEHYQERLQLIGER